ncbi:MAG: general secretion pathway protein A [Enterobacterales bacterium]|jgi:general secretion pathway protein A
MYDKYFGLTDKPFSIAPDPRYLFMSEQHREALAHLVYGVGDGGGFVLLTGEVGTGKTTVCRCLLEQLPEHTRLAFILNPKLSTTELLATVCDELHIEYPNDANLKLLNDALNEFLLTSHAQGLKIVLMIDEAQNLSTETLEQIRLLTNLETNKEKLLQIILIGQPELKDLLAKHELRQLAQRITARFHLRPLTLDECEAYILHRLEVSGFNDSLLFDAKAIKELYKRTGGVPRLINVLCDRSMLGAYARNLKQVSQAMIKQAASEVMGGEVHEVQADTIKPSYTPGRKWRLSTLVLLAVIIIGGGYSFYHLQQNQQQFSKLALDTEKQSSPKALNEKQAVIDKQSAELDQIAKENQKLKDSLQAIQDSNDLAEKNRLDKIAQLKPLLPFIPNSIQTVTKADAQQQLFKQWKVDYNVELDGEACNFARENQLRCETEASSWWQLSSLNRPAILKLSTPSNEHIYAVLISLEGVNVRINFGGKEILLSRQQISEYWNGEITYFWQSPPDYETPLSVSMTGTPVQWLLTNFAKLDNLDLIVPPDAVFDSNLKATVKTFQVAHSLKPDGIAGPYTMIKLTTLTNTTVPTLSVTGAGY